MAPHLLRLVQQEVVYQHLFVRQDAIIMFFCAVTFIIYVANCLSGYVFSVCLLSCRRTFHFARIIVQIMSVQRQCLHLPLLSVRVCVWVRVCLHKFPLYCVHSVYCSLLKTYPIAEACGIAHN